MGCHDTHLDHSDGGPDIQQDIHSEFQSGHRRKLQEAGSVSERLVADAGRRTKGDTDSLDSTLQSSRVSVKARKGEKERTERVWMYPSACSTGIVSLRFN